MIIQKSTSLTDKSVHKFCLITNTKTHLHSQCYLSIQLLRNLNTLNVLIFLLYVLTTTIIMYITCIIYTVVLHAQIKCQGCNNTNINNIPEPSGQLSYLREKDKAQTC